MTTSAAQYPGRRNPNVVYLMSCTQQVRSARDVCRSKQRVLPFYRTTHASSTWLLHLCHHYFWTFCWAVHQPGDVHKSTFHQICNHSWSCRTSILVGATFHRINGASSFEVLLAGPSRLSSTGTLSSGTSGSRRISPILPHERTRRRIPLCQCGTLINIVTETAIVSFRTLPVGLFPIANNILDFFVHAVLSPDSLPRRLSHNLHFCSKKSCFGFLARYFFFTIVFNL